MVTKAGNEAAQELQELQQAESDRHGFRLLVLNSTHVDY